MMKLTKMAAQGCAIVALTACGHHIYEQQPQTYHTDYAQAQAIAPDGDGGVYLLSSGWAASQGGGDYRFALAEGDSGGALQTLMQQGRIRDSLPAHACAVRLYVLDGAQTQPASAVLALYFPPALFAGVSRPAAIRSLDRDYPIAEPARRAAAQRGFALPKHGRLSYLQVRLVQGQSVSLRQQQRAELLRRYGLHAPLSACRHQQRIQWQAVGRESWLKIM